METLEKTTWDVVIAGTGLQQSLLALALSRSNKKILHLDRSEYYGGDETALSLSECETWAQKHGNDTSSTFSHASIRTASTSSYDGSGLSFSRAYSLSLNPTLIYTSSALLPALVSSKVHNQLEFQAVGSWFVYHGATSGPPLPTGESRLLRVPSGREDVFADKTIDLKGKRHLMKFLRFVAAYKDKTEEWEAQRKAPFSAFLEEKFRLPQSSHGLLSALTLSPNTPQETTVDFALPRIARHLRSIGIFGPGFGAVLPKWGGLAEISQVACRACAVGGGVYVLNKGVKTAEPSTDENMSVMLDENEKITTSWLVGSNEELENAAPRKSSEGLCRSMNIVSSPLKFLFPPTSEGGPTPAGAVVVISKCDAQPVHIMVHSSDSGECPQGQCVVYASIALSHDRGYSLLDEAVNRLLQSVDGATEAAILWSMHYEQHFSLQSQSTSDSGVSRVIRLPSMPLDLVLDDTMLENVKEAWKRIVGADAVEQDFLRFEQRGDEGDEEFE